MKKIYALFSILFFSSSIINAQNVGINTSGATPDASSMLDIVSTSKGVLIPRVTLQSTTDGTTISSPQTGLLVYNTTAAGAGATQVYANYFYYNAGTTGSPSWVRFSAGFTNGPEWNTIGNSGTTAGTNFIGTTDAIDFVVKTTGTERARFFSGGNLQVTDNSAIKLGAAYLSSGGNYMHLANNEYYNGAAWVGNGTAGVLLQFAGNALNIYRHDGAGGHTFSAAIDGSGNMGVGVAPASLFHVNGAARLGTASSTNGSLIFNNSTNANTLTINTGVTSASYAVTLPTAQATAANQAMLNNGSGTLSWATVPTTSNVMFTGFQVFTSSGTFTLPAGVTKVMVEVWGGGGGGGGSSVNGCNGGYGGNGGGSSAFFKGLVTVSSNLTVTIGAGGTAGAGSGTGGTGGTSSLTGTGVNIVVTGGAGGTKFTGAGPGAGGSVTSTTGAVAGCTWSVSGYPGIYSIGGASGGIGGHAPQGGQGGGPGYAPGATGNVPGGGGAGCESDCVSNKSGGAGAAGTIVIWW